MGLATLLVAAPFAVRQYSRSWPPWSALRIALLGGVLFAADIATWATGVMLSGANSPTLLANTAPLWVGVGAMIFFRQRLTTAFWVGTAVALIGAAFVLGLERDAAALGALLGLIAAIFYAGYFLVTQLGREKLDSLSYFWLAAISSTTLLFVLSRGLDLPLGGYSPATYLTFAAMAVFTQIFGYFSINFALGYLPASIVAPALLGQPVITALLAGPLLGESLGPSQFIGGTAVIVGVFVAIRSQRTAIGP